MITKKIKRIIYEYEDGSRFVDENHLPDFSKRLPDTIDIMKLIKEQKYTVCSVFNIDLKDMNVYCCTRVCCPSNLLF